MEEVTLLSVDIARGRGHLCPAALLGVQGGGARQGHCHQRQQLAYGKFQ